MTSIKIPTSSAKRHQRLNSLGELAKATGWERAALIATEVRLQDGPGQPSIRTSTNTLSTVQFAALGIVGLKSDRTVRQYVERWMIESTGHEGPWSEDEYPQPGDSVQLPELDWPPSDRNLGGRPSVDPAKAINDIIERDGEAALEAAAQALVDREELDRLSRATGQAAQNRQVQRNRNRAASGTSKGSTPKPKPKPSVHPGFTHTGLSAALTALVTTFPNEWAQLSDADRQDQDYLDVVKDQLDRIDIATSNARALVQGLDDRELEKLLKGGA